MTGEEFLGEASARIGSESQSKNSIYYRIFASKADVAAKKQPILVVSIAFSVKKAVKTDDPAEVDDSFSIGFTRIVEKKLAD